MVRLILMAIAVITIAGNSSVVRSMPFAAADVIENMREETDTEADSAVIAGSVTGEIGKTYSTQWFDFSVESVELVPEYAGYVPEEGNILVDIVVTEVSTFDDPIPMGTFDFFVDHITFEDYIYPLTALNDTMMPEEYTMNKGESVTYHLIYEIPEGLDEVSFYYVEVDETDQEGTTFRIKIS